MRLRAAIITHECRVTKYASEWVHGGCVRGARKQIQPLRRDGRRPMYRSRVTHTTTEVLWKEMSDFTECGVNPIIVERGRGVVIWGARTLSEADEWKHINTRRIVSYIREQLYRDSAFAVFENNNQELWKILERVVSYRLDQCGEGGLLAASQGGADYLVQCDRETNPQDIVNAGQIHVRVWIRPVSTTERILVDMRLGSNDMSM